MIDLNIYRSLYIFMIFIKWNDLLMYGFKIMEYLSVEKSLDSVVVDAICSVHLIMVVTKELSQRVRMLADKSLHIIKIRMHHHLIAVEH